MTLHGRNIGTKGKHAKLKSKLSFVFPRALSHARSLQRFLFWNPLCTRETPRWALPCVSNEFTWRPTVYQRHFLPAYIRACASHTRAHTRVRVRVCVCACACARGSASMWAEIPCSGRCWTIFPWPPRDTKLGMIIPYLPTEGRAVPSCRLLRLGLIYSRWRNAHHFLISNNNVRLFTVYWYLVIGWQWDFCGSENLNRKFKPKILQTDAKTKKGFHWRKSLKPEAFENNRLMFYANARYVFVKILTVAWNDVFIINFLLRFPKTDHIALLLTA